MQFAYVISVLRNLMDAHWRSNEAIEMHVCKLSMGLEKLKFVEIVSMLLNNWLMVSSLRQEPITWSLHMCCTLDSTLCSEELFLKQAFALSHPIQ